MLSYIKILLFIPLVSFYSFASTINIDKSVVDANTTNKHIMLFLHKDNCGYCDRIEVNLSDINISKAIQKDFLLLDINRDGSDSIIYQDFNGTNRSFMKELDINFYPTILFVDTKSDAIIYALYGYMEVKELLVELSYISSYAYTRISLEEYKGELFFD